MKALLLDLDDTLLDDREAVRLAYSALIEAHRHRFPDKSDATLLASWRTIATRHWTRFERGEISFQEQRRQRVREFLDQPFSDTEADTAFEPYLDTYQASWRLFDDVPAFLALTADLPRIIVTNGERTQQLQKIHKTGLSDHVTSVITSTDCGSWKPDPGIFLAAVGRLGVEASQCGMIGDDEVRDIQPAQRLGMRAYRVAAKDPARTLLKALEALRL